MNETKLTVQGTVVWFISVLFYLYEFLLRTVVGSFQPSIMSDLKLTTFSFTLISSTAYLFVYGLMQIPIGAIINRCGFKNAIMFASLVCALSTMGFAHSHTLISAIFFRSLMGLGSAFGFLGVLVAVYDWMPRKNIALFIGLSQFLGTLGPMIAGGPISELAHSSTSTWQSFFFKLGLTGLLLSLLIFMLIKNSSNKDKEAPFIILEKPTEFKKEINSLITQQQFWYIAIFCACIYFSLEYLSENECKNLLLAKGLGANFAAYMITLAWLGFAVSSPLFGYFSDRARLRKPFLIFSAITTVISISFIVYFPLSELGAIIAFVSYGVGVGSSSVGIAIMAEQLKTKQVSSGLGLNNAVTILLVSILAPIISFLLSFNAQHLALSLSDYQRVFALLILLPVCSLVIALFKIKETFGRSSKELIILNY